MTRRVSFAFVGEKRSDLAIKMGVRWEDGRLAAKTLHEALRAVGLNPLRQTYLNIFVDGAGYVVDPTSTARLLELQSQGVELVAMGRRVQHELDRLSLRYRSLVHPAARGKIRAKPLYLQHVADVLGRRRKSAAQKG